MHTLTAIARAAWPVALGLVILGACLLYVWATDAGRRAHTGSDVEEDAIEARLRRERERNVRRFLGEREEEGGER